MTTITGFNVYMIVTVYIIFKTGFKDLAFEILFKASELSIGNVNVIEPPSFTSLKRTILSNAISKRNEPCLC